MRVYIARKSRLDGGHGGPSMMFDREVVMVGEEGGECRGLGGLLS